MKDGVTKGTGNSRYLKSAITDTTTWEQFRDMLRGGTLPIDLNGVNTAGWQVVGDGLNKANLLPDEVAKSLGLTQSNPQVKDALIGLKRSKLIIQKTVKGAFYSNDSFTIQTGVDLSKFDYILVLIQSFEASSLNSTCTLNVGGVNVFYRSSGGSMTSGCGILSKYPALSEGLSTYKSSPIFKYSPGIAFSPENDSIDFSVSCSSSAYLKTVELLIYGGLL